MSTSAQQIANQANAQKSTGPTTPDGKARSAMNSQIHGLCAKHNVIGPEEQADFDRMATHYVLELLPKTPVEHTLYTEIVGAAWQLARVSRMETEACAGHSTYTEILDDELLQKKLERLARHHTRIERTFHRCRKELKTLQAQRKLEEASPDHAVAAESINARHFRTKPIGGRKIDNAKRPNYVPEVETGLREPPVTFVSSA